MFTGVSKMTLTLEGLAQHSLQNEGYAEMPDPPMSVSSSYLCHRKCHQILSLLSLNSSAGGLLVFSAISIVSLFEVDDDTNNSVGVGRYPPPPPNWKTKTKNDCMLRCTLLMQLGLKRSGKSHTAQLIHPVGNGTVWYLAAQWSALILWDLSIRRGGRVLAVKVFTFTVLFAEVILFSGSFHLL